MIYVDSSVILAELLAEDRRPAAAFWDAVLVSSRLLEYEVWSRCHARNLGISRTSAIKQALALVAMYEMSQDHLERAVQPFPATVRTLDSLHLATMEFLRREGRQILLASYDHRLIAAAAAVGIEAAVL